MISRYVLQFIPVEVRFCKTILFVCSFLIFEFSPDIRGRISINRYKRGYSIQINSEIEGRNGKFLTIVRVIKPLFIFFL